MGKNGKSPLFQSVASKMLFFVVALLAALLAENVLVTVYAQRNATQSIINTREASLKATMLQIDNEITAHNDYVVEMMTSNEDYLWIARQPASMSGSYQLTNRIVTLGQDCERQMMRQSYMAGVFAFFPKTERYFFRTRNYMQREVDMYAYFRKHYEEQSINELKGIHTVEVDGSVYVTMVYQSSGSWGGGWINLNTLLAYLGLDQQADMEYYFSDEPVGSGWIQSEGSQIYRLTEESVSGAVLAAEFRPDIYERYRPILMFAGFTVVIAIATAIFLIWVNRRILRPLSTLRQAIGKVESGDLEYRIGDGIPGADAELLDRESNEIERMNMEFDRMLEQVRTLKMNMYEMQLAHQKAELRFLNQQVRPHFILNALNIIYSYQEKDYPLIREMVLYLTRYFRYIVNVSSDEVALSDEFTHTENYLKIQKVRYPYQFDYSLELDERVRSASIPPLIIQSFVENAIKYAIRPKEMIQVCVSANQDGEDRYRLEIYDTGPGYPPEVLREIRLFLETDPMQRENEPGLQETGLKETDPDFRASDASPSAARVSVGIRNAIERMQILYQEQVRIEIGNRPEGGAHVVFSVPIE